MTHRMYVLWQFRLSRTPVSHLQWGLRAFTLHMYFKIDNINLQPNLPVASDLRQILLLSQTRPITARVHFRASPQLIICSSVSPDCPLKDLCPVDRLVSTRSKLIGALQKVNQFMVICLVNIPNHESFKCHNSYVSDSNCIFLVISTVINS